MDDPLQKITIIFNSNNNSNNTTNITEPLGIINLKELISSNENILQQSTNEITAYKNTITQTKQHLHQTQSILLDEFNDKEFLIDNLEDSYTTITTSIPIHHLDLLLIFFNDCLRESLLCKDSSREEAKLLVIQKMNRVNRKEMKKTLMLLDNTFYDNFDKNNRREIQAKLYKLKEEIYEGSDCQDFYYNLFNCLKCLLNIADWKTEVKEYKQLIEKCEKKVVDLQERIKEISRKNDIWRMAVDEIERKYKERDDNGYGVYDEYDEEIGVYIERQNRRKETYEFDEIKMLISHLEDNYVGLLKRLSKMIIKPKSLTRIREKHMNH